MRTSKISLTGILFLCTVVLAPSWLVSCKDDDECEQETLYQKLGERPGIEAAVEQSILAIASDPVLTPFFAVVLVDEGGAGPGLEALKENIADFVDENSGGPGTYTGLSMAAAHAESNPRMTNAAGITNSVYDDFLDAMIAGAQQAGINNDATLAEYRILLEQSRSDVVN